MDLGETPALGCARSLQWEQGWLIAELGPRGGFGPNPRTYRELWGCNPGSAPVPEAGRVPAACRPRRPPQPEPSRAPTRWLRAAPCPDTTAAGEPQHARTSRSLLVYSPDMPGEGFPLRGKKPRTALPETSRPPRLRRTPRHLGHRSSAGFGCPQPLGQPLSLQAEPVKAPPARAPRHARQLPGARQPSLSQKAAGPAAPAGLLSPLPQLRGLVSAGSPIWPLPKLTAALFSN